MSRALLKVHNDIWQAVHNKKVVLLVLLDLSAAFDTIDHDILLHTLRHDFGVREVALRWFQSYLHDRRQAVIFNGSSSETMDLNFGVPQGSVLGPLLFALYTTSISRIAQHHGLEIHLYADEYTQIYTSCNPDLPGSEEDVINKLT